MLRALVLITLMAAPAWPQSLNDSAIRIFRTQGPRAALAAFESALAAARNAKDAREESIALNGLGNCHRTQGDPKKALEYYRASLAIKERLGDRLEQGKTHSGIGLAYRALGQYASAVSHYERALPLVAGDRAAQASVENNLGDVLTAQGKYALAREHLERAAELGSNSAVENIGGIFQLLGHHRTAIGYYERALAAANDPPDRSHVLGNLALCRVGLGEIAAALDLYDQAIALSRQAGLRSDEADWHKGKGSALRQLGRHDAAFAEYRQAIAVYEAAGEKQKREEALADLGYLHLTLGDAAEAEKEFRAAVALARAIGDTRGEIGGTRALGDLESRRRRYPQAVAHYQTALARALQAGNRGYVASTLLQLAFADRELRRFAQVSRRAAEALEIARDTGARLIEAEAQYLLGEAARLQVRPDNAIEHYRAGESITTEAGETELGWRLAYSAAQAFDSLHQRAAAIAACRRAATVIETVRSQLREERFQAGYIEDKYQVYVLLIRLLIEEGQLASAFSFAERLHARRYTDQLRRGPLRGRTPAEVELRERVRQLQQELERENRRAPEERRADAVEAYSRELSEAERQYQNLLDDRRASGRESVEPSVLGAPVLAEIQAALAPATALLEYVVGEDRTVVFVITAGSSHALSLPVRGADLAAKVELLRALIGRPPGDEWRAPASSLGRLLVDPLVAKGWLAGIGRLYIVPHQVLHYLPFGVLPGGAHFLGENFAIAYLPAAAVLSKGEPRSERGKPLLAVAPARPALKHTAEEIKAILEFFPSGSLTLSGARATEAEFKTLAPQYDVLHLATHASFNRLTPVLSSLDLEPGGAEDGRLEVGEILDLRLNASLVTLSACGTAMASGYFAEVPSGDDFVGLTRAFLYAGSRSVLASLWEVDDLSTSLLMRAFYSRFGKTDRARALAAAQEQLRKADPKYQHPYYWAPFVLVGKMN